MYILQGLLGAVLNVQRYCVAAQQLSMCMHAM